MRFEKVFKNGFVGVFSQIVIMFMGFLTQRVFLHYLGETTLGMNSVVSDILNMLALAELGVGSAITFHLYKPLAGGDEDTVASIMQLFKQLYRKIGIIVFSVGIILMILLPVFINEPDVDMNYVRIVFFIQLLAIVSTYFLSYKRTLLYADQKNYICAIYDTLMNIFFSILRIISIILFYNNIIYLMLNLLQQIAANLLISHYCNKAYPKIKDKNVPVYEKKGHVFQNMKDIVIGKIAVYIYSSTDSLVISKFSALTGGFKAVGGLANYTLITNAAKSIVNSFVYSMTPAIGGFLAENKDKKENFKLFNNYTFARHYIANVTATGLIVCISPLVSISFGMKYVLTQSIVILICVDLFISIVHGPINEFISALGLFQYEKYINAAGAAMNIIISIVFVQLLGVPGVLLGTAVSQLFFWVCKSILVIRKYFKTGLLIYWGKVISYIIVDIIQIAGIWYLGRLLFPEPSILGFLVQVAMCVLIPTLLTILLFFRTEEYKYTYQLIMTIVTKLRSVKSKS